MMSQYYVQPSLIMSTMFRHLKNVMIFMLGRDILVASVIGNRATTNDEYGYPTTKQDGTTFTMANGSVVVNG